MSNLVFDPSRHVYMLNGVIIPGVTSILQMAGIGPDLSLIPAAILNQKRDIGTFVHEAAEYIDMGAEPEYYPGADGYIEAYRRFKADYVFDPIEAEMQVYSKTLKYAGTIDRIGMISGKLSILDIKTTSILEIGYVGPQTAAYEKAYKELAGERKSLMRYALQLKPDGTYKLQKCTDKEDFMAFMAALNVYRWRERHWKVSK